MNRMRYWLLTMALVGAGCFLASAADPALATEPVRVAGDEPGARIPELRDPFSPVGYIPKSMRFEPRVVKPSTGDIPVISSEIGRPPDWPGAFKKLKISGTSRYRDKESGQVKFYAVVNDKFLNEGDTSDVAHDGMIYRFVVGRVMDKNVVMNRMEVRPR